MTSHSPQRGVTLVELLVTVVILGFTVALMSGAFTQIAQMLRVSTEQSNGFLGRWNQSRALYDIVGNMVIDPTLEKPFTGQYDQMDMITLGLPEGPPGVPRHARLRLKPASEDDNSTDLLLENPMMQNASEAIRLTRFPGRLEFRYIDHRGQELVQWPPTGMATYRPMPSAILIRQTDGRRLLVRAAAYEGGLSPKNNALAQAFGIIK
ncbi:MAG: prepilin-type N-terminal cleavage/methylation domain-containing protein [Rhodoferax sp.]|nr:prepilin-type N-terminal cleavage/methylation domain-containing protein [Rhodoferax sp.]NCS60942.1 prepilin-type N-terminal cleavage/methylation domain-containing protein [Rhodoferax sp.]OIP17073.1 MAG: hypothetical protein AUK50_07880 [Comamonadaceae bacterium CG2_30_57_122]PIZ21798.1 MAG: hypothetical protein COY49_11900 [Comamonadaceae bacterium CG_4_10_14_0_8_um_filter_57_29]